jgi:hypothetical protein
MQQVKYFCTFMLIAIVIFAGCAPVHFTVNSAPVAPEHTGSFKTNAPEIPVTVQITNFVIETVDTQYSENEKELFRRHMSIVIPNVLQESLGKRQAFSQITRAATANPVVTNYMVSGTYNFAERLGTQGREWIPFAGLFGAKINRAWVKGTLAIFVIDAKTGAEIFRKSYIEEHRDNTSIYSQPRVGYLQADYLAAIANDIIDVIKKQRR